MASHVAVRSLIEDALKSLFGSDCYVPSPISTRRKSGARVYRISGGGDWGVGSLFKRDGKILLRMPDRQEPKEITRKELNEEHDDWPRYRRWQWHILNLGAEQVERHLTEVLSSAGHEVDVRVGRALGGGSSRTSIAVELKTSPAQSRDAVLDLLMRQLPPPGGTWSTADRVRWLGAAAVMFDLLYGAAGTIEITGE